MAGVPTRKSFTLRFHDAATHRMLSAVASELGLSMTEAAELFIIEGLDLTRGGLAWRLQRTLDALSAWQSGPAPGRRVAAEDEARAFAAAEVEVPDPLTSRLAGDDPHGIRSIFAGAMGR